MSKKNFLQLTIEKLKLQILILTIQLQILLLKKKKTVPNLPGPKYVVVHHGGGDWSFSQVNNHHKNLWGFESSLGYFIGYHKWISSLAKLYVARRDNEEGAHLVEPGNPGYWNKNSVGIGIQGNYDKTKPPDAVLRVLKEQLDYYTARGLIVKMHCEVVATSCPGKHLVEWVENYRKGFV